MIDMLKEIILDFQEIELPTGVPRRVTVSSVPGKAMVCIGVRRSGKSTLMFQLMKKLQDNGVARPACSCRFANRWLISKPASGKRLRLPKPCAN